MGKIYKNVSLIIGLSFSFFYATAQKKEIKQENTFIQPASLIILDAAQNVSKNSSTTIFEKYLKLDKGNSYLSLATTKDDLNIIHEKFQQQYKGIKVEFGTAIIDSKKGQITSLHGEYYNVKNLDISPRLNRDQAFEYAKQHTGAEHYLWENPDAAQAMDNYQPGGELVILPNLDAKDTKGVINEFNLVYKFDIYATKPLSRGYLYIDATTGTAKLFNPIIKHATSFEDHGTTIATAHNKPSIVEKNETYESFVYATGTAATRYSGTQNIETTLKRGSYTLNDSRRKIYTRNAKNQVPGSSFPYITNYEEFTDNDNNWTAAEHRANKDNAAIDAHWGAAKTYDYFSSVHNRRSYDNRGAQIRSYVHVGTDYNNAFWNGSVMSYGDGSSNGNEGNGRFDALTSIDVAAHEIAHAVTTYTADLAYRRESGALNEGFSDIWGAAIEHYAKGNGSDSAPAPEVWLIGDEIDKRRNSPASRSMSDPTSLGKPDTYGGQYWLNPNCGTPNQSNDNCGVHYNSGVLNHWFYLTVVGGSGTNDVGNTYNVTGIGMSKSEKIAYRTLSVYLSANSTFANARTAAIQATKDLYGAGGAEEKAVTNAWHAVNVGDAYVDTNQRDTEAPSIPTRLTSADITETTFTLSWDASTDNIGVDGYEVYRGNTKLGTIDRTSANITGLTKNTTYQFRVKAYDAADNISDYSAILNVKTIGGSTGDDDSADCTSTISSFPYNQGYENTLGDWTQSSNDDTNWTVDRSGTPSSGTGPSSANEGSYYIFVEASGEGTGFPNKQAIINSPCYNLSDITEATFSFDYHMYGDSDMGSIAVEASTNNGATWSRLWRETGNKGNSWKNAVINLSNYIGTTIQLRFNRITGGSWKADVAIDNIMLNKSSNDDDNNDDDNNDDDDDSDDDDSDDNGTTTSICDGVPPYSSSRSYRRGDRVVYQGDLYERGFRNWSKLGPCESTFTFSSNTTYDSLESINNSIIVYPNPTNNSKILTVSSNNNETNEYQIIDMLGKIIRKGTFTTIIDIQRLDRGMYILKINTETTRFVIN